MSLGEQIKADLTKAMKERSSERVKALRLVLSELQKSAKEGGDDELAVLRRERKRRLEAATAFREGARPELAEAEEAEAELIATYLPAELSNQELAVIVTEKIAEVGAAGPQDMGKVMKLTVAAVAGRADGKRVSEHVRSQLTA